MGRGPPYIPPPNPFNARLKESTQVESLVKHLHKVSNIEKQETFSHEMRGILHHRDTAGNKKIKYTKYLELAIEQWIIEILKTNSNDMAMKFTHRQIDTLFLLPIEMSSFSNLEIISNLYNLEEFKIYFYLLRNILLSLKNNYQIYYFLRDQLIRKDSTLSDKLIILNVILKISNGNQSNVPWLQVFSIDEILVELEWIHEKILEKSWKDIHSVFAFIYKILGDLLYQIYNTKEYDDIIANYLPRILKLAQFPKDLYFQPTIKVKAKPLLYLLFQNRFMNNKKIQSLGSLYLDLIPLLIMLKSRKLIDILSKTFGSDQVVERIIPHYQEIIKSTFPNQESKFILILFSLIMIPGQNDFIKKNSQSIFNSLKEIILFYNGLKEDIMVEIIEFYSKYSTTKTLINFVKHSVVIIENSIETFSQIPEFSEYFLQELVPLNNYFKYPFQKFIDIDNLKNFVEDKLGGYPVLFKLLKDKNHFTLLNSLIKSQVVEDKYMSKKLILNAITTKKKGASMDRFILLDCISSLETLFDEKDLQSCVQVFNLLGLVAKKEIFSYPYGYELFTRSSIITYKRLGKNYIQFFTKFSELSFSRLFYLEVLDEVCMNFKDEMKLNIKCLSHMQELKFNQIHKHFFNLCMENTHQRKDIYINILYSYPHPHDYRELLYASLEDIIQSYNTPYTLIPTILLEDQSTIDKVMPQLVKNIVSELSSLTNPESDAFGDSHYIESIIKSKSFVASRNQIKNLLKLVFLVQTELSQPLNETISAIFIKLNHVFQYNYSTFHRFIQELVLFCKENKIPLLDSILESNIKEYLGEYKNFELILKEFTIQNQQNQQSLITIKNLILPNPKTNTLQIPNYLLKSMIQYIFTDSKTCFKWFIQTFTTISWKFFNITKEILIESKFLKQFYKYSSPSHIDGVLSISSKYSILGQTNKFGSFEFLLKTFNFREVLEHFKTLEHFIYKPEKFKSGETHLSNVNYFPGATLKVLVIDNITESHNGIVMFVGRVKQLERLKLSGNFSNTLENVKCLESIITTNSNTLTKIEISSSSPITYLNPLISSTKDKIVWDITLGDKNGFSNTQYDNTPIPEDVQEYLGYVNDFIPPYQCRDNVYQYLTNVSNITYRNSESTSILLITKIPSPSLKKLTIISSYGSRTLQDEFLLQISKAIDHHPNLSKFIFSSLGFTQNPPLDVLMDHISIHHPKIKNLVFFAYSDLVLKFKSKPILNWKIIKTVHNKIKFQRSN